MPRAAKSQRVESSADCWFSPSISAACSQPVRPGGSKFIPCGLKANTRMNSNDRISMEMVLMAGTPAGVPQGVEGPGTNLVSLERKKCASHRNMCFVHEERDIDKYHLRSRQPKFPLRIVHEIKMECRRTGMEALDPLVKTNSTTLRIP